MNSKLLIPLHRQLGILVTLFPMVNFVICVLISLNGLLESILTSLKLEHEKSEQFSAFHTISVIPLQPENAFSPMFVTLFGIVTEVRPLQPENA